jgi:hypothetical protein
MSLFVLAVGVLITAGSLVLIVAPGVLKGILSVFLDKNWIRVAAVARIGIGVLFIFAAPDTRFPGYIMGAGVVILLAGLTLAFMGSARTKAFVEWWMAQSNTVMRLVAVAGILFGASCIWAAI